MWLANAQANVLTGLVNLSVNTLEASNVKAFCILCGYIILVNGVAGVLRMRGLTLKL